MISAFAVAAKTYRKYGVVAISVRPDESRAPCLRFATLKRPLADATIDKMAARFPDAATALVCGPSGLTVVDIDILDAANDNRIAGMIVARFGDTPLIIESPKGGLHLYFRSTGESNGDLRAGPLAIDGDVRGDGGLITVPPTIRKFGPYRGRPYRILRGELADLRRLPPVKPGVLDFLRRKRPDPQSTRQVPAIEASRRREVAAYPEDRLFRHLQKYMYRIDLDGLIAIGREFVSDHGLDIPAGKVISTAGRVHKFAREHPGWTGGPGQTGLANDLLRNLIDESDALALLVMLVMTFRGRQDVFPISAKAMAAAGSIREWGPKRYRAATRTLLSLGALEVAHTGGKQPGDVSLYCFSSRVSGYQRVPDRDSKLIYPPPPPPPAGLGRKKVSRKESSKGKNWK
jgi:hypothetical protein